MPVPPKALMVASVAYAIERFNGDNLRLLQELGYEVHVAASFDARCSRNVPPSYMAATRRSLTALGIHLHDIPISRHPLGWPNFQAYRYLCRLMAEENFQLIHAHTPIGGALTRLAARSHCRPSCRVLYTAHGFHFYLGAPSLNWLLYYPLEKWLARFTDYLIVINQEDSDLVRQRHFSAQHVRFLPGVGLDPVPFLRLPPPAPTGFTLACVGELNANKNQEYLIRLLPALLDVEPDTKLICLGDGPLRPYLLQLARHLGVAQAVELRGYCLDVPQALAESHVVVSASQREGLPVSLMEALAAGRPLVISDIRGHRDLVAPNQNGFLAPLSQPEQFLQALSTLAADRSLLTAMSDKARTSIEPYRLDHISPLMRSIYQEASSVSLLPAAVLGEKAPGLRELAP